MRDILYKLLQPAGTFYRTITPKKLRVLAYHDVRDPLIFENQLKFLKENFNVLSMGTFTELFGTKAPFPDRSVLITFDDGDPSVADNALPLLIKHRLPAVMFVITDVIGSRNAFWWKKVEEHYNLLGKTRAEARGKVNELKRLPNRERLLYLSGLSDVPARQLDDAELKALHHGGVAIANHTSTHPMLDRCEPDEVRNDLRSAKLFFQRFDPGLYHILAYPNGNIDVDTERVLVEEGIEYAFLFDHKLCAIPFNPMRISRIRVNADDPMPEFKVKVSGLHSTLGRTG